MPLVRNIGHSLPPSTDPLPTVAAALPQLVPGLEIDLPQAKGSVSTVQVHWQGHCQAYAYRYSPSSTPKALENSLLHVQSNPTKLPPLLIVPYLSEERLNELVSRGVSGLDLCGNVLLLSRRFCIWRSGSPNRFSESRPLKNVFRGKSSIYSRCFILLPEFESLTALRDFAQDRLSQPYAPTKADLHLTLATASKVARALEEQLLIRRDRRAFRRVDLHGLMHSLARYYEPSQGRRIKGKAARPEALFKRGRRTRFRSVHTGLTSAAYYGVLSAPDVRSIYVSDLAAAAQAVALTETNVFPNLELIEEPSDLVYFDGRPDGDTIWASPVQTWLELGNAGPREQEAGQSLAHALRKGQFLKP